MTSQGALPVAAEDWASLWTCSHVETCFPLFSVAVCSAPESVSVDENNAVNEVVAVITVNAGVTVNFKTPPTDPDYPFMLNGNQLIAVKVLDYEVEPDPELKSRSRTQFRREHAWKRV